MSRGVLVTGGTGKTGSRLVARLRQEVWAARAASRSGAAPAEGEGARFDWYDPGGHEAALAGVDRVYLIAPIGSNTPVEVMEPFIELAIARGVRRFVLQSSSLIEEGGPATGAVHALLRRRAPEWAVLQPSWFMENFTVAPHLSTIRAEDAIYSATGDGRVPFISVADIAEAGLRALTDARPPDAGLVLTGPGMLRYDEVAAIIGDARGRPVRHVRISVDALASRHEQFGIPPEFAAMLAGLDGAIAAGADARVTDSVARMTGSPPRSFTDFAAPWGAEWRRT